MVPFCMCWSYYEAKGKVVLYKMFYRPEEKVNIPEYQDVLDPILLTSNYEVRQDLSYFPMEGGLCRYFNSVYLVSMVAQNMLVITRLPN